jgi:hypothetical protein
MDQGGIFTFKPYYLQKTSKGVAETVEVSDNVTLRDYFVKRISSISAAWSEVSKPCMKSVWCKLWPNCIPD